MILKKVKLIILFLILKNIESIEINKEILSEWFPTYTSDKTIDLSSKRISYVHKDTFNGLVNLNSLYLYMNQLTSLNAKSFNGLSKLQNLQLQINLITNLDPTLFNGLSMLNYLYFQSNQLTTLDPALFK